MRDELLEQLKILNDSVRILALQNERDRLSRMYNILSRNKPVLSLLEKIDKIDSEIEKFISKDVK